VQGYASTSERLCQPVFRIFEGDTQSIHINVGVQPELFATSAWASAARHPGGESRPQICVAADL